jgi:hypothetical protein
VTSDELFTVSDESVLLESMGFTKANSNELDKILGVELAEYLRA